MGREHRRNKTLAGIDVAAFSVDELKEIVQGILEDKIYGVAFSPYVEGQGPGIKISEAQIRERLSIIQPYVQSIRTFSCTDGNELIPKVATELGLKTMVGVWLDEDHDHNMLELNSAIEIANAGYVDILAVGNEVLLRDEMSETQLIEYLNLAKQGTSDVPVGYVDAYFKFAVHPNVSDACDVILANCYPFWEGIAAEHALVYMKEMFRIATRVANGKPVIISETGWPNIGTPERDAVPSFENAIRYFINTYQWAEEDQIDIIYFSAFDEAWKVASEGDVGAYWGLWDKDGMPKYV